MEKKLYRDEAHKTVGGVCAGLAEYFGIDVSIIRVLFLLTLICKGGGGILYIILWAVLPKKPYHFGSPSGQGTSQPFTPPYNPPYSSGSHNQPFVDYTVPPVTPPPAFDPQFVPQPKKTSSGSVIAGSILVVLGTFFIVKEFGLIPHWHFSHMWPVILIIVGIGYVVSGSKKQPWETNDWNKKEEDNSTNNNPPTI